MERIDCPHDGRHNHGTATAYHKDKCRCEPCRAAHSHALDQYRIRKAHNLANSKIEAQHVIEHMDVLRKLGYKVTDMARDAGVHEMTIHRVYRERRCSRETEQRLLELEPPATPVTHYDSRRVNVNGTRLRLQALHAIGYPIATLGRYCGLKSEAAMHRLINPNAHEAAQYVTLKVKRRVEALYDHLWDKPPTGDTPMKQRAIDNAIKSSAKKGWVPPFGLDEERMDDPFYRPDPSHNRYRKAS